MKKIIIYILIPFTLLMLNGCEDFLNEDAKSKVTSVSIFESEANVEAIVGAAYVTLRMWYGKENGWDFTESGTDIFTEGTDLRTQWFNQYTSTFTGTEDNTRSFYVWSEFYTALNTCNLILENIDNSPLTEEKKKIRKSEIYFLRAHYLWLITETWGDVVLSTKSTTVPTHIAKRSTKAEFYTQIFSDLTNAEANAPAKTTEYGRITKPIVEAFMARMYLFDKQYTKAGEYADKVIANTEYKFINTWNDIWKMTNIKNSELIWICNYSNNDVYNLNNLRDPYNRDEFGNPKPFSTTDGLLERDGGHQGHLMFNMRPENIGSSGVGRDLVTGRGFIRWRPTLGFIQMFNESLDQRLNGSFRKIFRANVAGKTSVPVWPDSVFVYSGPTDTKPVKVSTGTKKGKPVFAIGDTAIYFTKDQIPFSKKCKFEIGVTIHYRDIDKGYICIDIDDMYLPTGEGSGLAVNHFVMPYTLKFIDSIRQGQEWQSSRRDAYIIRLAEVYLIAAEAATLGGDPAKAYSYMLTLANARAIGNNGAALLASYGINTGADIDIDKLLDERARELAGEHLRFYDLKRTGKLVERVKKYNFEAAPNIKDIHQIRFIPTSLLDALANKEEFGQNPGY